MTIAKNSRRLRENLKGLLATPRSQATFSASSINCCCCLKERLETQPESTTSNSFVIGFNFPSNLTSTAAKAAKAGFTMWRKHCRQSRIKDSIPAAHSLSKFTQKIIVYIVLTGKERLGLNIWLETGNQAKGTEDMIRKIQATEAHYQQKTSETNSIALFFFGKEAKHVSPLTSYNKTIMLLI